MKVRTADNKFWRECNVSQGIDKLFKIFTAHRINKESPSMDLPGRHLILAMLGIAWDLDPDSNRWAQEEEEEEERKSYPRSIPFHFSFHFGGLVWVLFELFDTWQILILHNPWNKHSVYSDIMLSFLILIPKCQKTGGSGALSLQKKSFKDGRHHLCDGSKNESTKKKTIFIIK